MLDLNHPQTAFIFAASRLLDDLLRAEQRIVQVAPAERAAIFAACQHTIVEFSRLNDEHFGASKSNLAALRALETALSGLCEPIGEPVESQIDPCARCGQSLKRLDIGRSEVVFCPRCSQATGAIRNKLEHGFGTIFI